MWREERGELVWGEGEIARSRKFLERVVESAGSVSVSVSVSGVWGLRELLV
jgi:hypothetical protein